MKSLRILIGGACACLIASAQVPEVRPQVAGRAIQEGQVTVVYLAPRFATAIRMPDSVNSVVLGDPDSFTAEHSEREPQIVFVKPITTKASQTNLLISTTRSTWGSRSTSCCASSPNACPRWTCNFSFPPCCCNDAPAAIWRSCWTSWRNRSEE